MRVLAVTLIALPLLWLAGEQHRENCITENRVSCSVLPWDSGSRPVAKSCDEYSAADRRRLEAAERC